MDLTIDLKNYSGTKVHKRTAARGIVKRDNLFLLIHGKYGDYKFPGGGVEPGETLEAALIREMQEETGFRVKSSSIKPLGTVTERRKGKSEDILEMTSHYFLCECEENAGSQNLDDYEREYDYQVIWLTLSEAISLNKKCDDMEPCPWVERDTMVMEYLLALPETK